MRMQAMAILVVLAAWLVLAGAARAQATVTVVETWPAGEDVTLASNQNFYLRLTYTSDKPVRIWARPYFRGKQVQTGSNPSQTYAAGSGEAFGWFFLEHPGQQVDEVRLSAGNGSTRGTPVVATWHGHVVGGNAASAAAEPDWVVRMKADAEAAQAQASKAAANASTGAGGWLLFVGFMLSMLALGALGLAAPAWAMWRWRGGWRVVAALPAAMMSFVVLRIVIDGARDPTSHNLWPFEVLQAGALSIVVMGVLLLARKFTGAGRG